MEDVKTGCVCPLAGFCTRHGVTKSTHQHSLCQNHQGYFNQWENCIGPGQGFIDCKTPGEVAMPSIPKQEYPENQTLGATKVEASLWQQAKNLASAAIEHAQNGFTNTETSEQNRRLAICDKCPALIRESMRCSDCGCHLPTKTSWSSSKCPRSLW